LGNLKIMVIVNEIKKEKIDCTVYGLLSIWRCWAI
jgi:hypothetical protein